MTYTEKLSTILGRAAEIAPLPVTLRYPSAGLLREGIKGCLGAAACLGTVAGFSPAPWVAWPLGLTGALFVLYVGQQWRRRAVRLALDEGGLTQAPSGRPGEAPGSVQRRSIAWLELERLRLNFYPHGRRSAHGTLVLLLRAGRTRLKLDSTLHDFATLLFHAAAAAHERGLQPDPSSQANLEQLGLWPSDYSAGT